MYIMDVYVCVVLDLSHVLDFSLGAWAAGSPSS